MDPKYKTVLAVLAGVVIGATLLGTAIAVPAAFHAVAFRADVAERGLGMMGERGSGYAPQDGYGMMGPRGQAPRFDDGACPGGDCGGGGYGMMGPRGGGQYGPGDGTGVCPNGETCPNGGVCPNLPDAPASES